MEGNHRRRRAISSSLGEVKLGEGQRVLQVEDPTEKMETLEVPPEILQHRTFSSTEPSIGAKDIEKIEQELAAAKMEKKQQRAPKQAVNRLELLTGIGRLVSDIKIDNVKFSLRSLKSRELRYVMENAARNGETNVGEALLIRNYTLAFSIYEIEDNPIYAVIGSDEIEDKVRVIDEFEEVTTTKLWDAYSSMINEGSKGVEEDLGTDTKQILDNVKKS
jgi:hypothetical protein